MQVNWLTEKRGSRAVIVVFGGWAIGSRPLAHLRGAADILFVDDYRSLDTALPDLDAYDRRILVAWSFGIAAYGHWQAAHPDPFDRKVAICGSLTPVDRRLGIPPVLFDRTVSTLSEDSFQLFLARCFDETRPHQPIDTDARREELLAVQARGPAPETAFDRIWIGRNDRIFPVANLTRSWESQSEKLQVLDAPHAPFGHWQDWNDLL